MIEELNTAGHLLSSALDRYVAVCLSISKAYFESPSSVTIFPELLRIVAQGQLVAAMELKLRTAKYTIARAHNSSPSLVPMHTLPPELMERIFLFVPEVIGSRVGRHNRPEIISQVCSRWRKIALALPSLWRYISIPFVGETVDKAWAKRGLQLASRAHPLPLDVFFHNQSGSGPHHLPSNTDNLRLFAENIAPHTHSLKFLFNSENDLEDFHSILHTCFNFCKPGVLKTLITTYRDKEGLRPGILVDDFTDAPPYMYNSCRIVEIDYLDHLLEDISVLRLQGVYPFWTSPVYYGLVELRLVRLDDSLCVHTPLISEEHLRGILSASPCLKTLEFSIRFSGPASTNANVVPVRLDHLEVLNLIDIDHGMLGALLRWISPGLRPLRFAIGELEELALPPLMDADVRSFFSRSNVTEIYAEYVDYSNVFDLLNLCPRLVILSWYEVNFSAPSQLERARFPISHPSLESLFIRGTIHQGSFPDLIGTSSTLQRVIFSNGIFSSAYLETGFIDKLKASSGIPDVRVVGCDPLHTHRDLYW